MLFIKGPVWFLASSPSYEMLHGRFDAPQPPRRNDHKIASKIIFPLISHFLSRLQFLDHLLQISKFSNLTLTVQIDGRGGCQVVNSKDPSLNTADAYSYFLQNLCLKRTKISKTEAGGWVIFEKTVLISALLIKLMKCANNHPLSCVAFQLMYKKNIFCNCTYCQHSRKLTSFERAFKGPFKLDAMNC